MSSRATKTSRSRPNHFSNVNSHIYEEVGPSEIALYTRATNEFERSSNRNRAVQDKINGENASRTQQKTNEPKATQSGNNGNRNVVFPMKRWQLILGLCILIFVGITLIAVISYLGYHLFKHKDSIAELQSQRLRNVVGQWQRWSPWAACSVSCGTGLQARNRTCLNSNQKYEGYGCLGNSKEYQICTAQNCIEIILFTSRNLENLTLSYKQDLIFQTVLTNEGAGYDSKTGVFTVPDDGVYIFSVQICVPYGNLFGFAFNINGTWLQRMALYGDHEDCSTGTTIQSLNKGSRVNIKSMSSKTKLYESSYLWNTFSGVLIRPYHNN